MVTTFVVSDRFFANCRDHGDLRIDVPLVFFESVVVMNVTHLTPVKTWRIYEQFIKEATHIQQGRTPRRRHLFTLKGDFCMGLCFLCADDDDDQQLREMYGAPMLAGWRS